MLRDARDASERAARENNVTVEWRNLWPSIRGRSTCLLKLCEDAVREETGDAPRLPSGPLHDAAEMVPHMPVVMMFAYSSNGLSHCKEERHARTAPRDDNPRVSASRAKTIAHVAKAG